MLDFFLLATFVVVLFGIILWFIRKMEYVVNSCYRMFLPSSKENLKKQIKALPHLSADLEQLAMPWGWGPFEKRIEHTVQIDIAPVPLMVPWGWPCSPGQKRAARKYNRRHSNGADLLPWLSQFSFSARESTQTGFDLRFDNIDRRFGEGHLMTTFRLARKDVSLPWDW